MSNIKISQRNKRKKISDEEDRVKESNRIKYLSIRRDRILKDLEERKLSIDYSSFDNNKWDKWIKENDWYSEYEIRYSEGNKIPVELGTNIAEPYINIPDELEGDPELIFKITNQVRSESERTVELNVSSFKWNCPGAIHYYSKLRIPMMWGNMGSKSSSMDHRATSSMVISCGHILEQYEIDKHKDSYKYHEEGDWYYGFYTEKSAIDAGKKFFEKYFGEGWILKINV